jgi:hypothetical protein
MPLQEIGGDPREYTDQLKRVEPKTSERALQGRGFSMAMN